MRRLRPSRSGIGRSPVVIVGSFVAKRGDRVEPRGVQGGHEAGERAEDRREERWRSRPSPASAGTAPCRTSGRPRWRATTTTAPRMSPIVPPMNPISADSVTSSRTIRKRLPPIARLMPISRVRSAIDMAIVLMTDRPPTARLIRAMPTRIELRIDGRAADLLVEVRDGHRRDARDAGPRSGRPAPRGRRRRPGRPSSTSRGPPG